jgi:RimJ/RimL family protein N-acetyltransferase
MNGSGQPRLQLVPLTPDDVRAQIDAMNEDEKSQLSPRWLDAVRHLTTVDPWLLGFAVVDRATGMSIGSCGFKGPPDAEGMVEIAYGIAADHRNMGYATEAAEALVAYAVASGRVRIVRAHTLSEASASARVLTKCAFRRLGQVIDPEDGLVWRWERRTEGEQ